MRGGSVAGSKMAEVLEEADEALEATEADCARRAESSRWRRLTCEGVLSMYSCSIGELR